MRFDPAEPRHDWTPAEVEALFELPFMELVFQAAAVHRAWFDPNEVQLSQLLSVKTGGCAENCGYCSQSQHFDTGVKASKLMDATTVIAAAMEAKAGGAQRFCMGAAWRDLKDRDVPKVAAMISGVKALGRSLLVFVEITLAQKSEQIFKKVRDELQNMPEVLECHLISGSFDYLVKARLAGMSEYRSLLGSILQQMPVPAQSNSYVVMEEVKESFVVAVDRGRRP